MTKRMRTQSPQHLVSLKHKQEIATASHLQTPSAVLSNILQTCFHGSPDMITGESTKNRTACRLALQNPNVSLQDVYTYAEHFPKSVANNPAFSLWILEDAGLLWRFSSTALRNIARYATGEVFVALLRTFNNIMEQRANQHYDSQGFEIIRAIQQGFVDNCVLTEQEIALLQTTHIFSVDVSQLHYDVWDGSARKTVPKQKHAAEKFRYMQILQKKQLTLQHEIFTWTETEENPDPRISVLLLAIQHHNTPVSMLCLLYQHSSLRIHMAVLQHVCTPVALLAKTAQEFMQYPDWMRFGLLRAVPRCETLFIAACQDTRVLSVSDTKSHESKHKARVEEYSKKPASIQVLAMTHIWPPIRSGEGYRLIARASQHADEVLRYAALRGYTVPVEALCAAQHDPSVAVRRWVALAYALPTFVAQEMLDNEQEDLLVRSTILKNASTPIDMLEKYLHDERFFIDLMQNYRSSDDFQLRLLGAYPDRLFLTEEEKQRILKREYRSMWSLTRLDLPDVFIKFLCEVLQKHHFYEFGYFTPEPYFNYWVRDILVHRAAPREVLERWLTEPHFSFPSYVISDLHNRLNRI